MKLMFAERLKKYRRERNLTQEELAKAIGISPQSVSKWERDDGYPDITLLPRIAGFFGVTIDLLLGNDKADREEDLQRFFRTVREELPGDADAERLRLGLEYAAKYPENDDVAHELCWIIAWQSDPKKREEYLPVLAEQCEKLIRSSTTQNYRESAIELMCLYGSDEEYEKWIALCPGDYSAVRNEVLEKRLLEKERYGDCILRKGVNKLELFCHLMKSNCGNWHDPAKSMAWIDYRMDLMKSFGENGTVPPAWQGFYGVMLTYRADQLFRLDRKDEGYACLADACRTFAAWCAVPDGEALDVGHDWMFHGLRVLKNEWNYRLADGTEEYSNGMYVFTDNGDFLYSVMTMKRNWNGFDRVREEKRYLDLLEKAKSLSENR